MPAPLPTCQNKGMYPKAVISISLVILTYSGQVYSQQNTTNPSFKPKLPIKQAPKSTLPPSFADLPWDKAVAATEHEVDKAIERKDLTTLLYYISDSFKGVDGKKRTRTKKDIVNQFRGLFKVAKKVDSCITTLSNTKQVGGLVQTESSTHLKMEFEGPGGKPSMVEILSQDVEVWGKAGGRWQQVKATTKSNKMLINGRPAEPLG